MTDYKMLSEFEILSALWFMDPFQNSMAMGLYLLNSKSKR